MLCSLKQSMNMHYNFLKNTFLYTLNKFIRFVLLSKAFVLSCNVIFLLFYHPINRPLTLFPMIFRPFFQNKNTLAQKTSTSYNSTYLFGGIVFFKLKFNQSTCILIYIRLHVSIGDKTCSNENRILNHSHILNLNYQTQDV